MIKYIIVLPRIVVEKTLYKNGLKENEAIISIFCTPKQQLFKNDSSQILNLCFSDIVKETYEDLKHKNELYLFSEDQAKEILKFIDNLDNKITDLYIHCAAGISRSGAIGVFLNKYLGLDEDNFKETNKYIYPNPYVLEVLNKVSGKYEDYEKFWLDTNFLDFTSFPNIK